VGRGCVVLLLLLLLFRFLLVIVVLGSTTRAADPAADGLNVFLVDIGIRIVVIIIGCARRCARASLHHGVGGVRVRTGWRCAS